MQNTAEDNEIGWAFVDYAASHGYAEVAVECMKRAIQIDPEGAARRASGQPQYDQERYALASDCE